KTPATATSSPIFHLTPPTINNGQFLPGKQSDSVSSSFGSHRRPRPFDLFNEDLSESEEVVLGGIHTGTSGVPLNLERLTMDVLRRTHFGRFPGTDTNDDDHVLSPFTRRKGNATYEADKHSQQGSQANTLGDRKPPMPQLVGADGLPFPPSSGGFPEFGDLSRPPNTTGGSPSSGGPPRQVIQEELAKLPAYLKEAPICATHPT
ncbi:hypothetical protein OTU49_002547, partial [Cherax quadricarinatus]